MIDISHIDTLLKDSDSLEQQNAKLKKIVAKLMARVEQSSKDTAQGFVHFERSIALEGEVQNRTQKLGEALEVLNATNIQLTMAQREAEDAWRQLSNAVEAIHEGFAIFDKNDRLFMNNSRFSAMFPDVLPQITHGIHLEEYVKICASSAYFQYPADQGMQQWVRQRLESHENNYVNFTLALKNDQWLQVSEQKMSDGGTIVLQTDITDHARLEREERAKILDRQATIIKETLEHIEQGFLIFDHEQRLVEWNSAAFRILKLRPKLMKAGTPLHRFFDVFEPGRVFATDSRSRRLFDWAMNMPRKRVFRASLEATNNYKYDVVAREMTDGSFLMSFNDITQLSQAYEALHLVNETLEQRVVERTNALRTARDVAERANASKSRFVAAASHDLLQPINAAKLFISALEQTDVTLKQHAIVSRISDSFQSVETILGALLDISKLDSGKASLNICDFSLGPIFERFQTEFGKIAAQKGLEFRIVHSEIIVRSDPIYLRRILQNLVSNAIRYTNTGRVLMGARNRGATIDLYVIDTGVGIAPEDQRKVFAEFHRVDGNVANDAAMGLGLAIVERACHNLGHELALSSVLSKGTTMRVSVARGVAEHAVSEPVSLSITSKRALEHAMVMVVENDSSVRDAMERMLESWGVTPICASGAQDMYAQIDTLGIVPDIFLIDYHLDKDEIGLNLIDDLRAQYGSILAILLTADRTQAVKKDANSRGVFIRHKPLDIPELRELVHSLLSVKRFGGQA